MEITYLGHACFRLKGKEATVVCDPYDPVKLGLSLPKNLTADIVTISHDHYDHNFAKAVAGITGNPLVFTNPGEYEVKGVDLIGIASYHDNQNGSERGVNTIFRIDIDGLTVVHLGDLGHTLSDSVLEQLNDVDVLMIPVGGKYTIDAKVAKEIVFDIEPHITIPMHYRSSPDSIKNELGEVATFFKEMGKEMVVPQPKLVIKTNELPEEPQIILLQ